MWVQQWTGKVRRVGSLWAVARVVGEGALSKASCIYIAHSFIQARTDRSFSIVYLALRMFHPISRDYAEIENKQHSNKASQSTPHMVRI